LYSQGKLRPYLKNEHLESTFAKYPDQKDIFEALKIEKINLTKFERMVLEAQNFRFIVIYDTLWNPRVIDHLYQFSDIKT